MLTETLQKSYPTLTGQQKKVAEFILAQAPDAAFLSVAELARRVQTSQASVVRFAQAVGFSGYPELQQELREWVRQKISPTKALQDLIVEDPPEDAYSRIFQMDLDNIKETREANSKDTLDRAAAEIIRARRVGLVGFRTSHAIAYLLYYFLSRVRLNCELLDHHDNMVNQLMNFRAGDLLLAISFPRYGRQTIEILKYGKGIGCKIIAITDSPISPAGQIADRVLLARRKSASYFNSFTSAVTLVNCLAAGVSLKNKHALRMLKSFDRIDNEWKNFLL